MDLWVCAEYCHFFAFLFIIAEDDNRANSTDYVFRQRVFGT